MIGSSGIRTQIIDHNGSAYTDLYAVCSLGRTVIVAAGNGLWVSRDLQSWRRVPIRLTDDGVNTDAWRFLKSFNGRLWAGRPLQVTGSAACEFTMSGVLPAEFSKQGPW